MTLVVDLIDKRRQVAQRLLMLHIDRHSHIGPPEDFAAYNAEITECQRQIQEINNFYFFLTIKPPLTGGLIVWYKAKKFLKIYFFTAIFNALPDLNLGTLVAAILIFSPVRGLTPSRAFLLPTEKVPKPVRVIP